MDSVGSGLWIVVSVAEPSGGNGYKSFIKKLLNIFLTHLEVRKYKFI